MPRILKPTGCSIKHVSNGRNFFDDEQFLIEQWGEIPFEIAFNHIYNDDTGGPQIVQIMGSQGIVPLRNLTKRGLVLSTKKVLLERLFFEKKRHTISGNSYYFV